VGIAAAAVFTAWAILTGPASRVVDVGWNFPLNPLLIGVSSHLVLFTTGWVASRLLGGFVPADVERLTYWSLRTAPTAGARTNHG
jgi:SSS family solute:Na+ symporter